MSRVLFAWKYDPVLKDAGVPIFKVGPWWLCLAYRAVMWWQSVGYDAKEWLSRRLREEG